MRTLNDLTQDELKLYVIYDVETGLFTRIVGRNKGKIAGALDTWGHSCYA